jgi:amidophosphoribosyltransferase
MFDKFHDECGVFGVLDHEDAANLVYLGLYALQHRGQESAGIASISTDPRPSEANIGRAGGTDGTGERFIQPGAPQIHVEKEMGYVADIFTQERLARLPGRTAIGHVRYSTAGGSLLCNAQPLVASTNKGPIAVAHNGNFVNGAELRHELEQGGAIFNTMSDTEVLVHLVARSKEANVELAILDALSRVRGAYSIVFLTPGRIIAARDPWGFRPLALGRLGASWCVSSETCAFDLIEAETVREIEPGEVLAIEDGRGLTNSVRVLREPSTGPKARCVFEHVYFSRPDSNVFGQNVGQVRKRFGARLADEHPIDADLVAPVPDSGVFAALGYAQRSGIPF